MGPAYIDTSLLIAIKHEESSAAARKAVRGHRLFSSELLLAEVRSFAERESLPEETVDREVEGISWVIPDRPLAPEIRSIGRQGYLRGADLWHLACALYLSPDPGELSFLTLDKRQRKIAGQLGFLLPDLG
jgi:predicted nucleic acid-binding protein